MKKILIICLICFALSDNDKGPAANPKHPQSETSCISADAESGVSGCVDSLLWNGKRYYDRCCYMRYQFNGKMDKGCTLLTEEQYLDIAETIRIKEEQYENNQMKIYQLDCTSSYLKIVSIASALLALLL